MENETAGISAKRRTVLLALVLLLAIILRFWALYLINAPKVYEHEHIDTSPYSQSGQEETDSGIWESLMDTPEYNDGVEEDYSLYSDGDYIYGFMHTKEHRDWVYICGYTGKSKDLVLPETLGGKKVGGLSGFGEVTDLRSVVIPDSFFFIDPNAFMDFDKLESVRLPSELTEISANLFNGCASLREITIPKTVKKIGFYAFADCVLLEKLELPDGLETIESSAFSGCTSLKSAVIPDSVTSVDQYLFSGCTALEKATLGKGVTVISGGMFLKCASLRQVDIRGRLTAVESGAFRECGLESFALPEGVETLGTYAFYNCESLRSLSLPASLTVLPFGSAGAFVGCSSLEKIEIDENNQSFVSDGGRIFDKERKTLFFCIPSVSDKNAVPEGVISIEDHAFFGAKGLTEIIIPPTVEKIGVSAFEGSGLESVDLPESVTTVGERAFFGCASLERVTIGSGAEIIDPGAFSACQKLETVISKSPIYTIENNMLIGNGALILVMPSASGELKVPEGVKTLGDCCAMGTNITSLLLPSGCETVGRSAFEGCSSLSDVKFGGGESAIGFKAFEGASFEEIILPDSVSDLGQGAFAECARLKKIHLPASITLLDSNVLAGCVSLKEVFIPNRVEKINTPFAGCTGLERVVFGSGAQDVSISLFKECASLREVFIPEGMKIYTNVFNNAPALERVYYGGSERAFQLAIDSRSTRNRLSDSIEVIYESVMPKEEA